MTRCLSKSSDPSASLARSHVWRHRRDDVLAVLRCYYGEGISLSTAIADVCSNRGVQPLNTDSVRRIAAALSPSPKRTAGRPWKAVVGQCGFTGAERKARLAAIDKLVKAGAAEKSGAGRKGRR